MAHRVAPRAERDLDDIWHYVAKESGSIEIANRLIDSITDRFSVLAGFRCVPQLHRGRIRYRVLSRRRGRVDSSRGTWSARYRGALRALNPLNKDMKDFHLPLPEQTYTRLRAEAERTQVPATTLAREAIDAWLRYQAPKARHDSIAAYAAEMAATDLDLDRDLESAGIEHLVNAGRERK
jgi:plasmid stabilization system protein ParE